MTALLACLPVLAAAAGILLRLGPVWASGAAAVVAVVLAALAFRVPGSTLLERGMDYAPLVLEVLLILLFGMILAQLLRAAGAMDRISEFVRTCAPSPEAAAVLVVFGLVPFSESVTGFGIGVTVGVPILLRLGFSPARSALLGVSGLVAVPWGALGPGTAVAAKLAGLDLTELGVATAWANAVPIAVVAVLLCLSPRADANAGGTGRSGSTEARAGRRAAAAGFAVLAAACLFATILVTNILVGTPVAGVVGSAATSGVLILAFRLAGARPAVSRRLGAALVPYAILAGGLIACRLLETAVPGTMTALLATPPVWLAVAVLAAGLQVHRAAGDPAAVSRSATRTWLPVGVSTGLFMFVGWLMTTSGMSSAIGAALAGVGIASVPLLMGVAAVLTGSNTGANSMFSSTIAATAAATHAPVLTAVGIGNAAASFGTIATPSRIAMAVALAAPATDERAGTERSVQFRALGCVLAAEAVLTVVALVVR